MHSVFLGLPTYMTFVDRYGVCLVSDNMVFSTYTRICCSVVFVDIYGCF